MTKSKKITIQAIAFASAFCLASGIMLGNVPAAKSVGSAGATINEITDTKLKDNRADYFDENVVMKLPDHVALNEEISVIVSMNVKTVLQAYNEGSKKTTLTEFVASKEGQKLANKANTESDKLIRTLKASGVEFTVGNRYDTILCGFEINIKARDLSAVEKLLSKDASVIVGDVYERAEATPVYNDVDVYETGIFDSSASAYQGDGVVVAVLDTGLDYTHSAFDVNNFTTTNEAFTLESVSQKVSQTSAAGFTTGLTGADVYLNKKVPYAYDYADKDPDVLPINSEHGTHVAGIIAGKDDTITGVAPNAQLAIMKVFSDTSDGAKTSWLMAALEDCVVLGVDVINMSLGSSCGFTREVDEERVNVVYDSILEAGISLITAASNDYNATHGSDKNGSLGLTSNPDSGTVGSPSTYEGALSVASVDGVKTPYLLYENDIIYFTEAAVSSAQNKSFVDDILKTVGEGTTSHDFTYVTIPGVGRSSDYPEGGDFYQGKIVLVKRGQTTFEDKVRVALKEKGAAGIIIYNNISGSISMSVGADIGAVCSITQDAGEKLAAAGTGIIKISKDQTAGPFMSDFSSWGPTSDLRIKPEITAHGGQILSAVPGQSYERLSGTSMAAPNQAGATALIRQYVKYSGVFGNNLTPNEVTARVNQIMMSTADIVRNKNGLPYAVRKQGAGLISIAKATNIEAFLTTFREDESEMDKTKLELGDDKTKSGVYEMTFAINNIGGKAVSYNVDALVQTEGVSTTYTSHGDTTVTEDGYLLDTATTVESITGGQKEGNTVTVAANSSAKVTVKIVLSDAAKQYLNDSFKYGMYVEGFITLTAQGDTKIDLNVPLLAFYGDWTEAPIFDEEYYDTNADELNAGLDVEDKLMADAYATKVYGGLYSEYIATLGGYYFIQNPQLTPISASKDHIAISNYETDGSSTICSVYSIAAGLLRNAKEVDIQIVEDSTGKTVYSQTEWNQRKSYTHGSTLYQSSIEMDFHPYDYNLKNNTKYTVTVTTYIDYGTKESQKNVRNTFEFPLYIDFQAPVVTNVEFRKEYDRTTKKTSLYADLSIYDNHYAMAVQFGRIVREENGLMIDSFGKYMTPVYSEFNSTSKVTVDLTDYVSRIKESYGAANTNTFIATCYDYAMNAATYEISLPDDIIAMYFKEDTIKLSPNETLEISDVLNIFPAESWLQTLDFGISDPEIVDIVNQTILAKKSGTATITARGTDENGNEVTAEVAVKVLAEGEEGYQGGYTVPEVNKFSLTGYHVEKAYYGTSSEDREIGLTDGTYEFGSVYSLSMFPSESVTLQYILDSYFPDRTAVVYQVGNDRIATVTEDGTIVAQAEGSTIISVFVTFDGKTTLHSGRVSITVKDPFTSNSIYLMSYKGLGGEVVIPDDRGITTIYSYAFSNYEFVEKDPSKGDVIDEEDPYKIKQTFIGDDTITKVVIPEGVTTIEAYAFANLTALEEVVFPSTLARIGRGAFYGCEKLKKVNLNYAKFINAEAFRGCALEEVELDSVVAIGDYTFANNSLNFIVLPATSQSLGIGAFARNEYLTSVTFQAPKMKIGSYAFNGCTALLAIDVNAAVISSYAFNGCSSLATVRLGRDVSVIGESAFVGTKVSAFNVDARNTYLHTEKSGGLLYAGTELVLAAPSYTEAANTVTLSDATTAIGTGAFAGNKLVYFISAKNVKTIGAAAFAGCENLSEATFPGVEEIGSRAFYNTALQATPDLSVAKEIGESAFAWSKITSVTLGDNVTVGARAFAYCTSLKTVVIGDNAKIGTAAFYCPIRLFTYDETGNFNYYATYRYEVSDDKGNIVATYEYSRYNIDSGMGVYSVLTSVTIGDNAQIGSQAFAGNAKLATLTLGENAKIGAYAFYNCAALKAVDLSSVTELGAYAFSGSLLADYWYYNGGYYYATVRTYLDGEIVSVGYKNSSLAPAIQSVDLSALKLSGDEAMTAGLGVGAFANCDKLSEITFGENIAYIPDAMFANCTSLKTLTLPVQVTEIGVSAFYGTSFTSIDLSNVAKLNENAFTYNTLRSVTLKEGAEIGDGVFNYNVLLDTVANLDKAVRIGGFAFANTAIKEIDLAQAEYVGEFAFAYSALEKVTFGDKLADLGENPFLGCGIISFAREEDVLFNGKVVGKTSSEDYQISETVKVAGGILYRTTPSGGLELISYPMSRVASDCVVEEGTVRIGARAFEGAALQSVTLPSTLKSLGDKAFYGCDNLTMVVFLSYNAPALEEEFNESYVSEENRYDNLPMPGGLGITDYYMWNLNDRPHNFYFGSNFVDYIGHIEKDLVMVMPANGRNYNTFVFDQYFSTKVKGANAATDATLAVIRIIAELPTSITLAHEDLVKAARAAYDAIPSIEQKALVTNYSVLQNAESMIEYLKNRGNGGGDTEEPTENKLSGTEIALIVLVVVFGASALGLGGFVVYAFVFKKKKPSVEEQPSEQEKQDENNAE